MKIIYFTTQVVFIALMVGVAGLFLLPLLPVDNNIELRIVESGSMEPNIMTGSLVVIMPTATYGVGDVVTFESLSADVPTTHRIIESYIEAGENYFVTKGDANEEADTAAVRVEDVLGKVVVDVPYAGFILDFARQPIGFSLLILLPALMIILSEIEKIWVEVRNRRKIKAQNSDDDEDEIEHDDGGLTDRLVTVARDTRMMDISTPVQYRILPTLDLRHKQPIQQTSPVFTSGHKNNLSQWATICLVLIGSSVFVTASFMPYTASYFNDVERVVGNTLRSVMLDFKVSSEVNTFNFLGTSLDSENSSVINIVEPENNSAELRYDINVEYVGGNPIFCEAILADMSVLPTIYSGPLLNLSAEDVDFEGSWSLILTLDENIGGYLSGDYCQVDVVYSAWHQDEDSDVGYHDEERVTLTLYAPVAEPFARLAPSAELLMLSTGNELMDEVIEEDEELNENITVNPELPTEVQEVDQDDLIKEAKEEVVTDDGTETEDETIEVELLEEVSDEEEVKLIINEEGEPVIEEEISKINNEEEI